MTSPIRITLPTALTLHLPMPPSVNHMFVNAARGRAKSKAYKAWITEAGWMLVTQRNQAGRHKRLDGPVAVTVEAYRPANKRRDLDNILKPILDLLTQTQTIADDRQVVDIWARWVEEGAPCTVKIEAVPA